jgi:hypothetical protein
MDNSTEIQTRIQSLLVRLPLGALKGLLGLLESLVQQEASDSRLGALEGVDKVRYDFSDLAGRLTWRGDAVAVQRALRDEW